MEILINGRTIDTTTLGSADNQRWLKQLHGQKDIDIRCGCNEHAQMHIRHFKSTDRYTVATNPGRGSEHVEGICEASLELTESQLQGKHYRAIEVIRENELSISTKHLDIFIKVPATKKAKSDDVEIPTLRPLNLARAAATNSGITLGSLGRELLARAWEVIMRTYLEENKFYPTLKSMQAMLNTLFLRGSIRVNLTKTLTLADVLWLGNQKIGSIFYKNKDKIRPIVLSVLDKTSVNIGQNEVQFSLEWLPVTENEPINTFVTPKNHWQQAIAGCRVSYESHENFFVIGLAIAQGANKPVLLERVELIPVTPRGLFVDSSYENQLFSEFEEKRRVYIRPNQRMDELDGYLPDALLLDTEKPTIVEVFGMTETNTAYHLQKDKKMAFYRTLDTYGTYYWHAYRAKKYPTFPPKSTQ